MSMIKDGKPIHINATKDDLVGNNGIGRYIFLPGSDGRAKEIAGHFEHMSVKEHPRGHHLYLGTLAHNGRNIDVAAVSSGMGCPSMEIILHELFHLGGKRFLRVGTAGSLQPERVKLRDIIDVQATVRDEDTTLGYMPREVPAVASFEMISAIDIAAKKLGLADQLHIGTVHCKSSFYAREFSAGPSASVNDAYIDLMSQCGVLASEMETATLFIQSELYHHQLQSKGTGPTYRVLSGAILGIMAIPPHHFEPPETAGIINKRSIQLALETIKTLFESEC